MADRGGLFQGLPPPSSSSSSAAAAAEAPAPSPFPPIKTGGAERASSPSPAPILKGVLKREKPSSQSDYAPPAAMEGQQKRLRFKTTLDATETQVIEAMQKITLHIKNPSKFSKASKLALQLIQAGSVKPETADHFVAILEAAMSSPSACTEPSLRADYHTLFSAAQDVADCLNKRQRNQLATWTINAVVANDLYTDDSFVFSKAAGRIKDVISSMPVATEDDDVDEAETLAQAENGTDNRDQGTTASGASTQPDNKEQADPFGLDALLPSTLRKDERAKGKKEAAASSKKAEEEESKRYLRSQREALILCLEIAARRYRIPWCQTVIDILVKHAFDNIQRFTFRQRDAIGKLWTSVREQQTRRKQGKSVSGKLDMNAFEFLQEKYANEKISIRHAVGGGGDRRAEQWLG